MAWIIFLLASYIVFREGWTIRRQHMAITILRDVAARYRDGAPMDRALVQQIIEATYSEPWNLLG